jgi:hypothetical protein
MTPRPVAVGLTLCDYLVIEEGTRKVSLVGYLVKLTAERFPFTPPPFYVFAALTDGLGDATIDLVVSRLDSLDELYARQLRVNFSSRLRERQVVFRISDCVFGAPGAYQFTLYVDGEWVAQRRLVIRSGGRQ